MLRLSKKNRRFVYLLIIFHIFLAGELIFRIRERKKVKDSYVYGQVSYFSPHHFLNYTLTPNIRDHNSLGFRGREVAITKEKGTYRIFCLGGSGVYGSRVWLENSYPYLFNEMLKKVVYRKQCEVINGGVHGYTSANLFIQFQFKILPLAPDMIIIYSGFNDIFPRIMGENSFDYSNFNKAWKPIPVLRRILFSSLISQKVIGRIGGALKIKFLTWPPHIHELVQRRPYQYFPSDYKKNFDNTTAEIFQRNILSLIQLAKTNNVEVILVTQILRPARGKDSFYDILKQGLAEHNSVIRNLARKMDVYLIDLENVFPKDLSLFVDDIHMNSQGNKIRTEIIAEVATEIINRKK